MLNKFMTKRFILRDEYDMDSPVVLESTEYVRALEEALERVGKAVLNINEDQVDNYTE
jgi:hypothetical protein